MRQLQHSGSVLRMEARWNKLLDGELNQWLPDSEESLVVGDFTVVKRTISERIGPEQCAELDLDSGAVTLVDSE